MSERERALEVRLQASRQLNDELRTRLAAAEDVIEALREYLPKSIDLAIAFISLSESYGVVATFPASYYDTRERARAALAAWESGREERRADEEEQPHAEEQAGSGSPGA